MSKETTDYTNESQQFMLVVLHLLIRTGFNGQPVVAIQNALPGSSRDQVFRALWNLEKGGLAERVGNDWMISPDLTVASDRIRINLTRLAEKYLVQPGA